MKFDNWKTFSKKNIQSIYGVLLFESSIQEDETTAWEI